MKVKEWELLFSQKNKGAPLTDLDNLFERFEYEHICWDPKDGELYLNSVKSEETLMEARSGTNVQIVRQIWV